MNWEKKADGKIDGQIEKKPEKTAQCGRNINVQFADTFTTRLKVTQIVESLRVLHLTNYRKHGFARFVVFPNKILNLWNNKVTKCREPTYLKSSILDETKFT